MRNANTSRLDAPAAATRAPALLAAVIASAVALLGCSKNMVVSGGDSIEDFERRLNGQSYKFDLAGEDAAPGMSGVPTTALRIPAGLLRVLAPADEQCKRDGGTREFSKLLDVDEALPDEPASWEAFLPQRIICRRGANPVWVLDLRYDNLGTRRLGDPANRRTYVYLGMLVRSELLSPAAFEARLQVEVADAQATADERDRRALRRQAEAERTRRSAAEAQTRVADRLARMSAFQSSLKVGDRFLWAGPASGATPRVGTVLVLEGNRAFVRIENPGSSEPGTRYLPKAELEPVE